MLRAEDPVQVFAAELDERAALLRPRYAEASVKLADVLLSKELVGLVDIADAPKPEFLRQAPLPGPEVPLRSATRLRRGRDHADAEILQRASHLRGTARINALATFGSYKEVPCA